MDSNKIFIDTDSEITFVLERVVNTKSERVVLVVPDRASLLSSITGLKLIKRVVDKSNKLLVLVTLDEVGASLCEDADLIVVSRVGEITEELWDKAQKQKFDVIKKSKRSHYIPDIIEEELKNDSSHHTSIKEEQVNVRLTDVIPLTEDDEVEETAEILESQEQNNTVENEESQVQSDVPQIRINVELNEVEKERSEIADTELIATEIPKFLSKDSTVTEDKDEEIDFKNEIPEPEKEELEFEKLNLDLDEEEVDEHKDTVEDKAVDQKRVRKSVTRSSGISNLSFAFGKDITDEKKSRTGH